jgi:protocatechuate 3,4-dioxygenase, beta subunit
VSIARLALLPAALAALVLAQTLAAQPVFQPPPASILGSVVTIVSAREPGQRMIVSGRLFALNGTTPLAGRRIGVYQTDAGGNYGHDPRVPQWARLHGWLRTDSLGRYEVRTIRPGPYPRANTPAHLHFVIETPSGFDGNTELRFEDDPRVTGRERMGSQLEGRFGSVRPVTLGHDGVLLVERDLRSR